jgi:cyclophilin family peptidyl-prolyl cis-trans isomerase
MARKNNNPDSASCQFFFCLTDIPEFDGKQTVFGQAVGEESLETLRKLGSVDVKGRYRPLEPPRIIRVTVEDAPDTITASKASTDADKTPRLAGER